MPTRVAKPGWRPVLAMRHAFGVYGLKHRALLEKKTDVLVVLKDLHRMRRERSNPAKWHAAAGVVAVLDGIVVVPLCLTPWSKRQRIRLSFITCAVRIRERSGQVLRARPVPDTAEIRFSVRKSRGRRLHVDLRFKRLSRQRSPECHENHND